MGQKEPGMQKSGNVVAKRWFLEGPVDLREGSVLMGRGHPTRSGSCTGSHAAAGFGEGLGFNGMQWKGQ